MKNKKTRRYFYYPEDDETMLAWIDAQQNMSTSVYVLIKNYIAKYGLTDVMMRTMVLTDEVALDKATETYGAAETANNVPKEETIKVVESAKAKEEVQSDDARDDEISPANRGKTPQQINDELLAQLLK